VGLDHLPHSLVVVVLLLLLTADASVEQRKSVMPVENFDNGQQCRTGRSAAIVATTTSATLVVN